MGAVHSAEAAPVCTSSTPRAITSITTILSKRDPNPMGQWVGEDGRIARMQMMIRDVGAQATMDLIDELPSQWRKRVRRVLFLLRLAVRLHRSRGASELPALRLTVERHDAELSFPEGWLEEHPLTRADLEDEATVLAPLGFALRVV